MHFQTIACLAGVNSPERMRVGCHRPISSISYREVMQLKHAKSLVMTSSPQMGSLSTHLVPLRSFLNARSAICSAINVKVKALLI